MNNFAPQLKQQGYTNQFREDYEFSVKQAGVSNADLLGQAFTGLGEVAATGYKIAEQYEAEDKEAKRVAKAKADEEAKARTMQAYNEFGRQKMLINSRAEQTGNWNQADLETRRLLDQFSRREGVEYGKLLELSGKTDFTGAYGREKDTRTFYNNKKNEQDYKAWEAMTAANPSLRSVYSPEEGVSLINAVNDSWDGAEKYLSKLNTLDPSRDAAEYNRTEKALKDEIGNNVVSALMVEIANNKDTLKLSSDVEKFRQDMRNKYTKAGVPGHILSIALDEGLNRSGVNDVIKSVNEYHTLYQKDIDMLVKTQVARGQEYLGATTEPYAAMWLQTDDWKSGRTFTESGRIANKYLNERMSSLAFRGELANQTPLPSEARGEIYGGYSKIVNGNVGTPVLKGGVLQDVLTDATNFYGTQDAETRKQAYKEILSKFDNVYSDAAIAALKSDANPLYRELGNTVEKQMQTLRNAKDFAVFEASPTPAAESLRILKQGPGADLLRVTKDGELVMVDGSKGFLQSTAITLSDMTGRYFGAAADLNKYFGEIYKDAETRKQMLEAGGIPELDPMTETVIGRKEWYLGTGDNHIKARQQLEQNTQAGEWNFNAVEGLGGKIWEGIKENTKGKIENAVRLGKNTKEFLTVDDVTDNSPFTKVFGLTPKEAPSEIEKLEKTLESEDLKPHIRRAVEGTIEILKNQDGTATATMKSSTPLVNAHMETPENYEGSLPENMIDELSYMRTKEYKEKVAKKVKEVELKEAIEHIKKVLKQMKNMNSYEERLTKTEIENLLKQRQADLHTLTHKELPIDQE